VAFERIDAGITAGREDLTKRALDWWIYDRQLYKLNRIVRTEMSTAYHRGVIAASREDADVVGYRWQLSASHPRPDICDYYADVDFGLGAGVWPKENVPADKAHPHCLCSLTPTTRMMRKDGKRGATSLDDFLARVSPEMRERLSPRWAQDLMALGVSAEALKRADGLWFASREAVLEQMGAERFAAAQAIGRARREPAWAVQDLSLFGAKWRRTRAALESHREHAEVAAFLRRVDQAGGRRVDSRELHYLQRRYIDGEPLRDAAGLDRWAAEALSDPLAGVHHRGERARYHVYSSALNRLVVIDPSGGMVTAFSPVDWGALERLGGVRWTLAELIGS
jgi:hypothetical protein